MSQRKFAVIFGIKYGLSDKIGKTEAYIRKTYEKLYHKNVVDALISDMKAHNEIKVQKKKAEEEEGDQ